MKRLPAQCFGIILLLFMLPVHAADIYVSPGGSDLHAGTADQPLATVAAALRKARELRRLNDPTVAGGIRIIVREGTYYFYEPLFIRPEDAGTPESPTSIEAPAGEHVIFSGGIRISNWQPLDNYPSTIPAAAKGKLWVADVPMVQGNLFQFRQLWVNNNKAVRAKHVNGRNMVRIISWNKQDYTCEIPLSANIPLQATPGLELFIHQWWEIAVLRIKHIHRKDSSAILHFHEPESKLQSEHPWPAPWLSKETGNSAFYLTNALQFLDEPGEWYLDPLAQKLYYCPRAGEDLTTATVVAPFQETLVQIAGTREHPVSHVYIRNISFQYTGWMRPSQKGHVPLQAGMYLLDAYKLKIPGTPQKKTLENQAWVGRPPAAVTISFSHHTRVEDCRFSHLAATGLDYGKGTQHNKATGNVFTDIGGNAIVAGVFSDASMEAHLPYRPKDERELCTDLHISNNLISNVANEDWGCNGIAAGFVRDALIEHNDISNVSYTGISVGWGWTKLSNAMRNNTIRRNKIQYFGKHNYDCAGIYTLSAQPGTLISENYIDSIYKAPYAHLPHHWFYLYTDEGSAYMTVKDNWTLSEKFLQNANGDSCIWTNNGPGVATTIKQQAGLQPAYHHLLQYRLPADTAWTINKEQPILIELVAANQRSINKQLLHEILRKNKVPAHSLYQWKNHYVIFGKVADVFVLQQRLQSAFHGAQVKVYDDLFYEFHRKDCADTTTAKNWTHIILTANLVKDTHLQQEYLHYHKVQRTEWPEVATGFCNASFQQLLLFRNGRQLMLVISIPKGKTLDELNPKTIENNPRVVEWNERMKKYQEGIEGTKKGETWVLLKQQE
jgi:hypothetical protein